MAEDFFLNVYFDHFHVVGVLLQKNNLTSSSLEVNSECVQSLRDMLTTIGRDHNLHLISLTDVSGN